jgi:hypothetical protein
MKVICPFTKLNPATEMVLRREYKAEFVDVSSDDLAYWRLLQRLWAEGESFVIVEHDICPWPGALSKLYHCPRELCYLEAPMFTYDGGEFMYANNVRKYAASLIARFPDAVENITDRHWRHCAEGGLYNRLEKLISPHQHEPAVQHLKALEDWSAYCDRLAGRA